MTRRHVPSWLHRSPRGSKSSVVRHDRTARALVAAAASRDEPAVERMLHPGVRLTVDGGGNVPAPDTALEGASEVGRYLVGVLTAPGVSLRVEAVNGLPGVIVGREGRVTGVLGVRVRDRLIVEAWLVLNPDKLTRWNAG